MKKYLLWLLAGFPMFAQSAKIVELPPGDKVFICDDVGNHYVRMDLRKNGWPKDVLFAYEYRVDNDRVLKEGRILNGKNVGMWSYYRENGGIKEKRYFEQGELTEIVEYYTKGNIKNKQFYKEGIMHGESLSYFKRNEGIVDVKSNFVMGVQEGENLQYYVDGSIEVKGQYKAGRLHGDYTAYHENGQLRSQGVFKEGLRDGEWFFYYNNGTVENHSVFVNGLFEGESKAYDKTGKLISTQRFYQDKLVD